MCNNNKISNFWTFISKRLHAETALADWRLKLGDELNFEKLHKQYLAPTDKMAEVITCPKQCDPSCGFRKVCGFEGKYEAVCREWPLNSYKIEKVDALYFTVKPSGLLPEITKIFKILPHIEEFHKEDDTWQLGEVLVPGQKPATVYMTLKVWNHEVMDLIFRLNCEEHRPYILLVTSRKVIHGTSDKVLKDMGAAFVPLNEVLDFNSDTEFELIRECNLAQLLTPPMPEQEMEPENIFRKCGDAWEVRFDGGKTFMLTSGNTGATYLHFMLARPNVGTSVIEIIRTISGDSEDYVSADQLDENDISFGYTLSNLPVGLSDTIVDDTALRQYCRELEMLAKDIAQAEAAGDNATAEQLQQDVKSLRIEMEKIVSNAGQKKNFSNQMKNIANACRCAVNFTIDKIAAYDPELSEYLRITIRGGRKPGYFPSDIREWFL